MNPVSQIIWRNRGRLRDHPQAGGRLLLVSPPADDLAPRLREEDTEPAALCLSFTAHAHFQAAGIDSGFGIQPPEGAAWPRIILFQPREKALLDMMVALCRSVLDTGGELWLAGENRAGIKSCGKRLEGHFGEYEKADSARHCTLFIAHHPSADEPFSLDRHIAEWPLETDERKLAMQSLPGVFAHGRLDPGTRLLLQALEREPLAESIGGRVLDFACGSGAVGLALAARHPGADLTLLDDSALALESARRSMAANRLEARIVASDGLGELLRNDDAPFDWIVSNPPFHSGVKEDLDIARSFIENCPRVMARNGRLCLVANRHLPYGRWLPELFGEVQVLAADREYNVWLASGPTSGPARDAPAPA